MSVRGRFTDVSRCIFLELVDPSADFIQAVSATAVIAYARSTDESSQRVSSSRQQPYGRDTQLALCFLRSERMGVCVEMLMRETRERVGKLLRVRVAVPLLPSPALPGYLTPSLPPELPPSLPLRHQLEAVLLLHMHIIININYCHSISPVHDKNCSGSTPIIHGRHRPESLLSCRVPNLCAHGPHVRESVGRNTLVPARKTTRQISSRT